MRQHTGGLLFFQISVPQEPGHWRVPVLLDLVLYIANVSKVSKTALPCKTTTVAEAYLVYLLAAHHICCCLDTPQRLLRLQFMTTCHRYDNDPNIHCRCTCVIWGQHFIPL